MLSAFIKTLCNTAHLFKIIVKVTKLNLNDEETKKLNMTKYEYDAVAQDKTERK